VEDRDPSLAWTALTAVSAALPGFFCEKSAANIFAMLDKTPDKC
jgi:hypothetical protein